VEVHTTPDLHDGRKGLWLFNYNDRATEWDMR
jgi:hypothetical protein